MLFLWLGFERNSIQYRPRGIICTFPISKINVCGYSLLYDTKEGGKLSTFPIYRLPFSQFALLR